MFGCQLASKVLGLLLRALNLNNGHDSPCRSPTVDDINPGMTLHTKTLGIIVVWYILGHAGLISSAVCSSWYDGFKCIREQRPRVPPKTAGCQWSGRRLTQMRKAHREPGTNEWNYVLKVRTHYGALQKVRLTAWDDLCWLSSFSRF